MTTNHRPTLEAKRGRHNEIKGSIQHSRALKTHTLLKLRLDVQGAQVEPSVGKRALESLQQETKRAKTDDAGTIEQAEQLVVKPAADGPEQRQTSSELQSVDEQHRAESSKESEEEGDSEDYGDDSEEEDGDSEAEALELAAELEKAKKEKERDLRTTQAMRNDPLALHQTPPQRQSWRSTARFARAPTQSKDYTTDTLNSATHKNFLSKYIG